MGRAFTMKEGLSRRGIPKFKVDHLKVPIGISSVLLGGEGRKMSVEHLRAILATRVLLIGSPQMAVMETGLLNML